MNIVHQKIFDNFFYKVNGNGRAVIKNHTIGVTFVCRYAVGNHPGCAIGCQSEFQEVAKKHGVNLFNLDGSVKSSSVKPLALEAFPDADIDFLEHLQSFHDDEENWDGLFLRKNSIIYFCEHWDLKVPKQCL